MADTAKGVPRVFLARLPTGIPQVVRAGETLRCVPFCSLLFFPETSPRNPLSFQGILSVATPESVVCARPL